MESGFLISCKYLVIKIMTLTFSPREALAVRALLSAALLGFRSFVL